MTTQKVDTSREAVERNWRGRGYSPAELEDLIFALMAERDRLRELIVEILGDDFLSTDWKGRARTMVKP